LHIGDETYRVSMLKNLRFLQEIEVFESRGLVDSLKMLSPLTIKMVEVNAKSGETPRPFIYEISQYRELFHEVMMIDSLQPNVWAIDERLRMTMDIDERLRITMAEKAMSDKEAEKKAAAAEAEALKKAAEVAAAARSLKLKRIRKRF